MTHLRPRGIPSDSELMARAHAIDDDLARLDERLRQSPIREGWAARSDLLDAAAGLWREGDLVALEDLVLHDSGMDVRAPTPGLGRAHLMLRARRRIAAAEPGWAITDKAQGVLLGQPDLEVSRRDEIDAIASGADPWSTEIAAIDLLLARSDRAHERRGRSPDTFERTSPPSSRLDTWRMHTVVAAHHSPAMAAAEAGLAWDELRPVESAAWLGPLLAGDLLRQRRKTRVFLAAIAYGLKSVARERRASCDRRVRLAAWLDGIALAADAGLRDHDRWMAARSMLVHKVRDRRTSSKLPRLIELAMSRPLLSSRMIAAELQISLRVAQDLATELGLREMTGRGRYRAWGVL